eukprot:1772029-Rhodomonas_salina.2
MAHDPSRSSKQHPHHHQHHQQQRRQQPPITKKQQPQIDPQQQHPPCTCRRHHQQQPASSKKPQRLSSKYMVISVIAIMPFVVLHQSSFPVVTSVYPPVHLPKGCPMNLRVPLPGRSDLPLSIRRSTPEPLTSIHQRFEKLELVKSCFASQEHAATACWEGCPAYSLCERGGRSLCEGGGLGNFGGGLGREREAKPTEAAASTSAATVAGRAAAAAARGRGKPAQRGGGQAACGC